MQMQLMQKAFDDNAMMVGRQQRRIRSVGPESLETQVKMLFKIDLKRSSLQQRVLINLALFSTFSFAFISQSASLTICISLSQSFSIQFGSLIVSQSSNIPIFDAFSSIVSNNIWKPYERFQTEVFSHVFTPDSQIYAAIIKYTPEQANL